MVTDPIADFLIRIKNAGLARRKSVSVPFSKMKSAVAEVLNKEGYIGEVGRKSRKASKALEAEILYEGSRPRINDVEVVSKPSRRMYGKAKDLKPYRQGKGMIVLSTPKGILSDREAKKENVGGEILFKIW